MKTHFQRPYTSVRFLTFILVVFLTSSISGLFASSTTFPALVAFSDILYVKNGQDSTFLPSGCPCDVKPDFKVKIIGCKVFFDAGIGTNDCTRIQSWQWDFGDGNVASAPLMTSHQYGQAGNYKVCLIVDAISTDGKKCKKTICKEVIVKKCDDCPCELKPSFNVSVEGCKAQFTDQSIGNICTKPYQWVWDFGDGSPPYTGQNPSHTYSVAGIYSVCLNVEGINLSDDTKCPESWCICKSVEIKDCKPCDCDITPAFSYRTRACEVQFFDQSATLGTCVRISQWIWEFGDGSTGNVQNPLHTFNTDGTYEVCLTVVGLTSDGQVCRKKLCQKITIRGCQQDCPCDIKLDFSYTASSCQVIFQNNSQVTKDCGRVVWEWDFGDTQSSSLFSPAHPYAAGGIYNVCLRIRIYDKDRLICEELVCKQIKLDDCSSSSPCDSLSGHLEAMVHPCSGPSSGFIEVHATGGTAPYQYSLDGGAYQTDGEFHNLGTGPHTITILDANGCTFSLTAILNGSQNSLSGAVTVLQQPHCPGDNSGSLMISASGGTSPYQYSVVGTFQPGNTFNGLSGGNYTIGIMDAYGCVLGLPFTLNPQYTLQAVVISQTNVSCTGKRDGSLIVSGNNGTQPYSYSLNNGPAQSSGIFLNLPTGTYTVLVTDAFGCTASISAVISLQPAFPPVDAGGNPTLCLGDQVQLSASAAGAYSWSPTVGLSCTACPNPVAQPIVTTTYTVQRTDINGCVTTDQVTVYVTVEFDLNLGPDIVLCPGQTVQLNPDPESGTYYWFPQNGLSCWDCPSPVVSVSQPITYHVIVTNGYCQGEDDITVSMNPYLTADFTYAVTSGATVSFSALPGGMISYQWNFGDPASYPDNTASGQNATHTFTSLNVNYNVCLTVQSICGPYTVCHPIYIESSDCVEPRITPPKNK